jgi:hypothetical protein
VGTTHGEKKKTYQCENTHLRRTSVVEFNGPLFQLGFGIKRVPVVV